MIAIGRLQCATEEAAALVAELDRELSAHYAADQRHGLSLASIFQPNIRFFLARLDGAAVGCGGVAFFPGFAEVKRMYVRPAARGRGVAQALIAHIEGEARLAGLRILRLETGNQQAAALRMYQCVGFQPCGTFGAYAVMPPAATATSIFMEKPLSGQ